MGKFLTTPTPILPLDKKGKYRLVANELYKDDDGSIYLAWQNFETDNFTWIKSNNWDIRCSHIHDVGCLFHQVVKVRLSESQLRLLRYLVVKDDKVTCRNIPPQFLSVQNISGHEINNLFYRMLRDADNPVTPKYIQYAYRAGVSLNFKWFISGKKKIDLKKLYDSEWNRKCYE